MDARTTSVLPSPKQHRFVGILHAAPSQEVVAEENDGADEVLVSRHATSNWSHDAAKYEWKEEYGDVGQLLRLLGIQLAERLGKRPDRINAIPPGDRICPSCSFRLHSRQAEVIQIRPDRSWNAIGGGPDTEISHYRAATSQSIFRIQTAVGNLFRCSLDEAAAREQRTQRKAFGCPPEVINYGETLLHPSTRHWRLDSPQRSPYKFGRGCTVLKSLSCCFHRSSGSPASLAPFQENQ
ncbi:hypothetical protein FOPE_10719 [Fonsecaea pedrosoi]|nr:hypothetical protein FOPE_10719 [Fonsecaea pedrosoi]